MSVRDSGQGSAVRPRSRQHHRLPIPTRAASFGSEARHRSVSRSSRHGLIDVTRLSTLPETPMLYSTFEKSDSSNPAPPHSRLYNSSGIEFVITALNCASRLVFPQNPESKIRRVRTPDKVCARAWRCCWDSLWPADNTPWGYGENIVVICRGHGRLGVLV